MSSGAFVSWLSTLGRRLTSLNRPSVSLSLRRPRFTRFQIAFGVLMALALGLRLWDLGSRPIHYDEGLHAFYSWQLFAGDGFRHEPWIHGPLQFFLNSAVFAIFWDSEYTVRLTYVFFGVALVGLPYFLRNYIGHVAALIAGVMLAFSPALFYFSRYSRNDIYMAVWALSLFILMWRYLSEGKNRYLYMASAVLALAFATKETAYIIVATFGLFLVLLSISGIGPGVFSGFRLSVLRPRIRLSQLARPAAFLLLIGTLTLPHWGALFSVLQGSGDSGVVLAYSGSDTTNPTGLPLWAEPFINIGILNNFEFLDGFIRGVIVTVGIMGIFVFRHNLKKAFLVFLAAALLSLFFSVLEFPEMAIARNYLIAGGILIGVTSVSVVLGLLWQWRVWLICAGIFYGIWFTLYTGIFSAFGRPFSECPSSLNDTIETVCSRFGGSFTGVWQSLGYWLAQQDVARGNQPWYYYMLISSIYEFLPLGVGLIGIIYYLRNKSPIGLFLIFWSVVTFLAYTIASEKMPWLLVNITIPFIILSAKLLGDLIESVPWRRLILSPNVLIMVVAPLLVVAVIYLLQHLLGGGPLLSVSGLVVLACIVVLTLFFSALLDRMGISLGITVGGMGVVVLLLGFTAFVSLRAGYNSDDQPVEMLVYAGASEEIRQVARDLGEDPALEDPEEKVLVDYELWYPFNWYVRNESFIEYQCYTGESGCEAISEPPNAKGLVLLDTHARRDAEQLASYDREGPLKELLWFPEVTYRRPGEDRPGENILEEVRRDLGFAGDKVIKQSTWNGALDYVLLRRISAEWLDSKFYTYERQDP